MRLGRVVEFAYVLALGGWMGGGVGCSNGDARKALVSPADAAADVQPGGGPPEHDGPVDGAAARDTSGTDRDAAVSVDVAGSSPKPTTDVPVAPAPGDAASPTQGDAVPSADVPAIPADAAAAPPDVPSPVPDASVPGPFVPRPSPMSIAVFDEGALVDIHLTFPPGEWDRLMTLMGPNETRWVTCTAAALGTPATPAACRRKGDLADWIHEFKPQIIVRFNLTDKSARFRGLRRLNLESFDGTAAPIRDRVGMWMMREAGIDAPRVNNARVFKDDQLLGVYQNIEAVDKEFLEDHFGPEGEGNLWESGLELKTNEDMPNATRLNAFWAAIEAEPLLGDHAPFYASLATRIDIDQFLREMAGETALLADDNFSNGSTNFSLYEHPRRGMMVIPWDFDSIITGGPADADVYDYMGVSDDPNKLRRLINQNPVWKAKYESALIEIRDQHLVRVPAKVDAVCAQIRDAIRADPNRTSTFADFEADCGLVKQRVEQRIAAIKQQLGR